jgi:hypothetical protein
MSPASKTEKEEHAGTKARRSTRLAIAIPITLSGKDAAGNSFKENTRTIVVNKHGAKIVTTHQLELGAEVEIDNRALGLTARAGVVWTSDQRTPQKVFEAGIQLFKAQDIWGIEFPPEDWQEGPLAGTAGEKSEKPVQAQESRPAAPKAAPAAAPIRTKPAAPTAAPTAKPAPPTAHTPTIDVSAELERMILRFTRQAEGIASRQTKVLEDSLQTLSRQIGSQTEARLRDASAHAEESAANAAHGLAVGIQALEERLQALRADVEAQAGALAEVQKSAAEEAEKAQRNIREASWQALESATEQLSERIQKELETVSGDFLSEIGDRVREKTAPAVESLTEEAETRLKARSAELAAEFEKDLQTILHDSREKSAAAASEEVRRIVEEQKAALAREFQERVDEARAMLKEEVKTSWKGLAEDTRRQLMGMATSTAESMNSAAAEGLKQFRAELEKSARRAQEVAEEKLGAHMAKQEQERSASLASRLANLGSETEERIFAETRRKAAEALSVELEKLAAEGMERIRRDFEGLMERNRKELEEATAAFQNQVMQDAQTKISYVTERLTEDSASQLAVITRENVEMAGAKLEEAKEKIVSESEDAFRARLAEVIAPALKPNDRRSKPRFDNVPSQEKS